MANNHFNSVDVYIALQPETVQVVLERVRRSIRKAVPEAEEVISYNIPTYKLHGRAVLYLAGWKKHYSLYPFTGPVIAAFRDDLEPYEVNNKGTIRFPLSQPVPVKLIERIAKFRANEVVCGADDRLLSSATDCALKKADHKRRWSAPHRIITSEADH